MPQFSGDKKLSSQRSQNTCGAFDATLCGEAPTGGMSAEQPVTHKTAEIALWTGQGVPRTHGSGLRCPSTTGGHTTLASPFPGTPRSRGPGQGAVRAPAVSRMPTRVPSTGHPRRRFSGGPPGKRCIVHPGPADCCRATRSRSRGVRGREAALSRLSRQGRIGWWTGLCITGRTQNWWDQGWEARGRSKDSRGRPSRIAGPISTPRPHRGGGGGGGGEASADGTNNVQERCNRETRRRSRVVQVFPSRQSLVRLVGAVVAESDETWSQSRYFAEGKMDEFWSLLERCGHGDGSEPITDARRAAADEEARKVLDAAGVAMEREAA